MTYFDGLKPTSMVPRSVLSPESITREELIVLLVRAGATEPGWRFGELLSNAVRPGTGAPALRHISDAHLGQLLRDVINRTPPQGLALS